MNRKETGKIGENATVSRDGTRIAYAKTGSGELVIAVFGATCFKDFLPVKSDVKTLSKYFTVINYDRRGRGGSLQHSSWSLQKEIEDIDALIDDNGGSAYIYGHSSGAVIALEAAVTLENKIKGVMIYDASYVSSQTEKETYNSTKVTVENLLKSRQNAKAIKTFLTEIGMPKMSAILLPLIPGWKTMKRLAPTLMYDITLTENLPPLERLQRISVPVLILAGDKNPESIMKVYSHIVDTIPNNQHHILVGRDHMASMKYLVPYMQKFLQD